MDLGLIMRRRPFFSQTNVWIPAYRGSDRTIFITTGIIPVDVFYKDYNEIYQT